MRARSSSAARAGRTPPAATVDLICCSAADGRLVVLAPVGARGRQSELPWLALEPDTPLDAAAQRLARATAGRAPSWMVQLGAFGAGQRHPAGAALSVAYVAVVPVGSTAPEGMSWQPIGALDTVAPRQRAMLDAAVAGLRDRMDIAPVAFRMLPPTFTLSELQEMYELLLGRRLHKASFRRALQSSYLVEPTDEWRSEGRGRPAQLFRYAPRKRRGIRRSVRFELLD